MRRDYNFYVYIMSSKSRVLYTGVTNNLSERVRQHKSGDIEGFANKYRIHRLVYFEQYKYVRNAIAREKEIKAWRREKRVALITSINPTWEDLAEQWNSKGEQQIPRPLRGLRDDNSEAGHSSK
jgi:putative endonuclease